MVLGKRFSAGAKFPHEATLAQPFLFGIDRTGVDLEPMMQKHLGGLNDLEVFIYPPRAGVVPSRFDRDKASTHDVGKPDKAVAASLRIALQNQSWSGQHFKASETHIQSYFQQLR
jgi:hypothetical protein